MGNVENPEQPPNTTATPNQEGESEFGKWVGSLFQSEEPTNNTTSTTTNITNSKPTTTNKATTAPVKQPEVVSDVYGKLTLKFSRGVKFPKNDSTRYNSSFLIAYAKAFLLQS